MGQPNAVSAIADFVYKWAVHLSIRKRAFTSIFALLASGAVAVLLSGCPVSSSDDCEALGTCTGSSNETTSTETVTTSSAVPPACSSFAMGDVVDGSCGVFVMPKTGSDENAGTKDAPLATIKKALEKGGGVPVYICEGTLDEAVTVTGQAHLFGGFACSSWEYTGVKAAVIAAPDLIALQAADDSVVYAQDLQFTASAAMAAGGSSIALYVHKGAEIELVRVDVTAGAGAPGNEGETTPGTGTDGEDGGAGLDGCINGDNVIGGKGGLNTCGDEAPEGGSGGNGTAGTNGGDGSAGQPAGGAAGLGQKGATPCMTGGNGNAGAVGPSGEGGNALGELLNTGVSGASGSPGQTGAVGNGGGGGGGARSCMAGIAGPSGGGGGAGGCGGKGGGGGGSGGASIGIAAFQAKSLLFTDVVITSANGGAGGVGGDGQPGGGGGGGGQNTKSAACAGGAGGAGGTGGAGGGGRGGHSIGIAWNTTAPPMEGVTITVGNGGLGGLGGAFNDALNEGKGDDGAAEKVLELP